VSSGSSTNARPSSQSRSKTTSTTAPLRAARPTLLAAEPPLQLEKPEHSALAMSEHLAVEQHVVADRRRVLGQLGKSAGRLFQVS